MPELPPLRRVVTGHTPDGNAMIESDKTLSPVDPRAQSHEPLANEEKLMPGGGGFINIWRTDSTPAKIQGSWTDVYGMAIPLLTKDGVTARVVDMPAGVSSPMHRTVSLDFGVVLVGEDVHMELDDGVEVALQPGEVVVQRGTIHAWHNRGKTMARLFFVLLPAENAIVNGETLESTSFGVN